jgi:hypothetical protein
MFNNLKNKFSDGAMASFEQSTIREEKENPEDEKKLERAQNRKRQQETQEEYKTLQEGAKGPKFSKKQINKEKDRRNATKYGNMTDY